MCKSILQPYMLVILLGLGLAACDGNNNSQVTNVDTTKVDTNLQVVTDTTLSKDIKNTASNFPSAIDFVSHIDQAHLKYAEGIINPTNRVGDYLTTSSKAALNLGIYLTDLGYNCLYSKAQEGLDYLKIIRKLSDHLNILTEINKNMVNRFEINVSNRDSLLYIVHEGYITMDEYLRNNQRGDVASLILAGSWLEGLYTTTQLLKNYPDKAKLHTEKSLQAIVWRVGGQKRSLGNLISILEKIASDDISKNLVMQLKDLQKLYESVEITEATEKNQEILDIAEIRNVNEVTDRTVINSISKVNISDKSLTEITEKVASIRASVVAK